MGHVKNTNQHRISVPDPEGDVPVRVAANGVCEADGELLDALLATRGVEAVSESVYNDATTGQDDEAEGVLAKQAAGESYKDPIAQAVEEHGQHGAGGITAGSAVSNPPGREPRSIAEAAHHEAIRRTAEASGISVEEMTGVSEAAPAEAEAPAAEALEDQTVAELRNQAKERGLEGLSGANKAELVAALQDANNEGEGEE